MRRTVLRLSAFVVLALTLVLSAPAHAATTPTPTAKKYPPAVQKLVDADSKTDCDEFAYAITANDTEIDTDAEVAQHAACSMDIGIALVALCTQMSPSSYGKFMKPATGNVWISCGVRVVNLGSGSQFVSPMDFSMVSATNTRYDYTVAPFVESPSDMFYGDYLPAEQKMDVRIAFEVSSTADKPLRLHYEPTISFSLSDKPSLDILIERL